MYRINMNKAYQTPNNTIIIRMQKINRDLKKKSKMATKAHGLKWTCPLENMSHLENLIRIHYFSNSYKYLIKNM